MRRREFITLLGGAAAWPLAAGAQLGERVRRIGVLNPAVADDAIFQARIGAFQQELALLGWNIGRNVRIDIRWATTNATEIRKQAAELVALGPDVILAAGDTTPGRLLADLLQKSFCTDGQKFCGPLIRSSLRIGGASSPHVKLTATSLMGVRPKESVTASRFVISREIRAGRPAVQAPTKHAETVINL